MTKIEFFIIEKILKYRKCSALLYSAVPSHYHALVSSHAFKTLQQHIIQTLNVFNDNFLKSYKS